MDINFNINGKKIPECWQGEILGVTRNNKGGGILIYYLYWGIREDSEEVV